MLKNIKCRNCNETFEGYSYYVYCSKQCRLIGNLRRANLRYQKNRTINKDFCKECSKEFIKKSSHHIYCSKICSTLVNKRKYETIPLSVKFENSSIPLLKLRFEILKRDNFTCQYCGRNPREHNTILHIDHIIPKSKGGEDSLNNLITSCKECNLGKYDHLLNKHDILKTEKLRNANKDA